MESGKILDSAITASSQYGMGLITVSARFNEGGCAWSNRDAIDPYPWIQADLGDITRVTGVATQGRCNHPQWVLTYTVSYSSDGQNWEFYKESGTEKVCIAFHIFLQASHSYSTLAVLKKYCQTRTFL